MRKPNRTKPKPKEKTPYNAEGGKELFDIVYVAFIIYLVLSPLLMKWFK